MSNGSEAPTLEQRADKPKFLTQTRFDDFDLVESLKIGLKNAGFENCTPIQAQTLPVSLTGKDVAGQAQTGTGKTAAFLVTVLNRLLTMRDRKPGQPAALIVSPTRELANQIYEEAIQLAAKTNLKITQILGGVDYQKQADTLKKGVDIAICTPGRIIDYINQRVFKTAGIKIVVIDEADRLLDLGFAKDMRYILRKLPHYEKRQSMLFSATLSYRVMELTYEYMNLPEFISVTPEEVTVEGIDQVLFHVGGERKLSLLLGLLKREEWNRLLIFVNTKAGVEWLTQKLKGNGWPAEGITGDLPQRKRFQLMERYKNGNIKILLATDVASRGIHVDDISHVINYDIPQDAENYVHRIGRTARAGKSGRALTLACERYVYHLEALETMIDFKIPVVWPEEEWYEEDKAGHVPESVKERPAKPSKRNNRASNRKKGPAARPQDKKPGRPVWKRKPGALPGSFFGFGLVETEPKEPVKPKPKEKVNGRPRPKARPDKRQVAAPSEVAAQSESIDKNYVEPQGKKPVEAKPDRAAAPSQKSVEIKEVPRTAECPTGFIFVPKKKRKPFRRRRKSAAGKGNQAPSKADAGTCVPVKNGNG